MDPSEILNVRFHFGGQFIHIGPVLDYVGGDEAISSIERDKLSLFEVQGHLKDHLEFKESMKLYFHVPGKELADGLRFLFDGSGCVRMPYYICVGDVADIYVEYHGEQDSESRSSASDYENEIVDVDMDDDEAEEPDMVITAELDDNGVLTQMNNIQFEQPRASKTTVANEVDEVGGGQTESHPHLFRITALEENMHAILTSSTTSWRGSVIINVIRWSLNNRASLERRIPKH